MSDIGEAIGTAAEGGLFARVVGGRFGKKPQKAEPGDSSLIPEGACLNCGTELVGDHCHACGQKVHIHRTISAIMHDLIHGVLHLDGKLWRTLPLLTFKPGQLTRRYIEGERAKFVSPMAMFLFSVFLMFAIFQALGLTTPTDLSGSNISSSMDTMQEKAQSDLDDAKVRLEEAEEGSAAHDEATRDATAAQEALDGLAQARVLDFEDNPDMKLTGIESLDEGIIKKWRENPSLMLYKLQNNSYKFSWALIPLSVPFVWLLFAWKRRFKAYDHAIFVTYSLGFMSLLFIKLSLLGVVGVPLPVLVLSGIFVPPVHIYKHLRRTYDLSRFGAFWRLMALSIFIWIVIALFLQILILLGAL